MVSLAKENKTARSLKASSVLYVGVERAKDVSQREKERKCKIILGVGVVRESDFPNLREKLKIILMVEASPRELPRLFFPPPPETHNTCRRRQGWTENGQETFGTSKRNLQSGKCEGSAATS